EALGKLLDSDFALVLLDFSMPGMTGIETARMVRSRPRSKGTPILFISGASPSTETMLEAFDVGALDFIAKPIVPEVLRAKVSVYLRLQERTQQLLRQTTLLREARERDEASGTATARASKSKDEFLAMLGHELRNPLAAMVMAVEALQLRAPDADHEISILRRQLSHLTYMVDDLVDIARITRGAITLRREAIELDQVVADALVIVQPDVIRLGHDVTVSVPGDLLLDADRHRLVQVISNLLSNAVKYTPPGGRIELTADAQPDLVAIVVRDNGRGISPALLSDLFELFVQGERPRDRREGGLGIGLTLVRTLVHLHGGSIDAHSDGPGKGAVFTLRWPRASPATVTRKLPVLAPSRSQTTKPLRVLIVDDNEDAAELLAALLGSMGHTVEVANRGDLALDVASVFAPDVALLDIGLPVFDGYEVARRMQAIPSCAKTVLIAVTGYGQPEDRARSERAGFAQHLVKPVMLDVLRAVFSKLAT
ncbi:MAG TPA: response regulator, partial [Kofleriaceae bacterium]